METSPPTQVCRACGTEFAVHAVGATTLCLGCLFDAADLDPPDAKVVLPALLAAPTRFVAPASVGPRFGQYEIAVREDGAFVELGRGGMGVTYRAVDTTLRCAVALKVVNPAYVQNARMRARFLREAQVAAGLRHPHVASVFHYRAEDGQLFYAMELVEGETLHARVRRCGGLPPETVLEIGTQVADALAAAEARGLAHRDLKPANLMLVEGGGVNVKVIDFGLAKAVMAEGAEALGLTGTQEFVGTPAFASPEQFNVWQDTDARSDFYALGATLWYALTGHAPFGGRSLAEIHDRQLHRALPLEQVHAAKVPAPLVALLCSLLSPDPAGRPQTAHALVAALAGCKQPRPDPPDLGPHQARDRPARAAAAVGAAVLLGAGLLTVFFYRAGNVAHQNALLQRQTRAQQQQLGAMQTQLQQQTRLIALISEKIDRNAITSTVSDPTRHDPAAVARAEIARERGISLEAVQKQLADERVDVREILAQIDQRGVAARAQDAQWQQLKRATLTRLGDGEYAAGHYRTALEPYQQALVLTDAETEPLAWCDAARNLELVLWQLGRYAEATPLMQQIVERRTALQGPEHPATLKALHSQASLFFAQGKYAEAEPLFRRVLAVQERTLGKQHPDTLSTISNLSYLLHYRANDAEAEALGRRGLEACERTLGEEHPTTLQSANDLACTLYYEGNFAECTSLNRRCLEVRERLLGMDHPDTIKSVSNLAGSLQAQGDLAGAEALFRRALEVQERTMGPDHPVTLVIVHNLGGLLQDKGDYAAAEAYTRRALEGRERVLGPDHSDTLSTLGNLAQLLDAKGDPAAAEPLYLEAEARMARLLPPADDVRLDLEHYFSLFREKQGRLSEALALAAQVAQGCKGMPENSPLRRTYEEHFSKLRAAASRP